MQNHNPPNQQDFEKALPIIDREIIKRKHKWSLTSLSWMDFDDVSQIVRLHIFKKWSQYNNNKPLVPWLNAIIGNQIKNLVRNNYSNYSRPCLRCAAAQDLGCKIYGEQDSRCPLYAHWQKRKQSATHIKMPVSIENHPQEVHQIFDETSDVFRHISALHIKMKELLKPAEYQVYEGLFILNEEEAALAKRLGYISNELGRTPGYKQLKNIRKSIIIKVKKCLKDGDVDIF